MNVNLETVKSDIEAFAKKNGFLLFYGYSRSLNETPEVEWDSLRYPDFRAFLEIAKQLGVRLLVLHHREMAANTIERALEDLAAAEIDYTDQRAIEQRLRELSVYEGFTCLVELSFDWESSVYVFELRTEWYRELDNLLEQIEMTSGEDEDDEDDSPLGGYYSKN